MHFLLTFFIYSFFGWITECIYCSLPAHKFINRGFLAGPYCPIYGCGAMLVIYLLSPFYANPLLLWMMGILFTSLLEYITSYLMEVLFHTKWWDYSNYRFHLHGRICLKNSMLFGVLVLLVYYVIHPSIDQLIVKLPFLFQICATGVFSLMFLYDLGTTTMALLRKNREFQEIEASLHTLYADFSIQELREDIRERLPHFLDARDMDEKISHHMERFKQQMEMLHTHRMKTHLRLHNAFPSMKESILKNKAEDIFTYLSNYKKKEK